MSQPFIGEIRVVGFNFAPQGWALCNGALLPISQFDALFALIGTTYGGDGQQTFQLPDLQGRMPVHQGPGFVIGQRAGQESVTLSVNQLPGHLHTGQGTTDAGTATDPTNAVWATTSQLPYRAFSDVDPQVSLAADTVGNSGGSQPHDNLPPFVAVTFVIALFGIFPSQN